MNLITHSREDNVKNLSSIRLSKGEGNINPAMDGSSNFCKNCGHPKSEHILSDTGRSIVDDGLGECNHREDLTGNHSLPNFRCGCKKFEPQENFGTRKLSIKSQGERA